MTFEDMKEKAAAVWARLTGGKEEAEARVQEVPMRSDPGHVIQTNGEAYRPVAQADHRLVSVNGSLYRTTPSVMMALHQAAERGSTVEGGFSRIMRESLAAGSMVRVAEPQQGWRPDLLIQYAPPVTHAKAHDAPTHDRGMSR